MTWRASEWMRGDAMNESIRRYLRGRRIFRGFVMKSSVSFFRLGLLKSWPCTATRLFDYARFFSLMAALWWLPMGGCTVYP